MFTKEELARANVWLSECDCGWFCAHPARFQEAHEATLAAHIEQCEQARA